MEDLMFKAKEFARQKFEAAGLNNHYMEVMDILQDEFGIEDESILSAGILHDTLEDTETTYEEIEAEFSKEIADYVKEVSHPKNYNEEQGEEYYRSLNNISPGSKVIKLADFTSHLRKFIGAFKGTSDYPKMTYNEYVVKIKFFLESCDESEAKNLVFGLADELDSLIKLKENREVN
jgi:guanosine-3',5'-bis(diphosphate) 3'-pyrophosphohydrolase